MIAFTTSGTGGHIYPAIAIAQELTEPCIFITEKKDITKDILKKYDFNFLTIPSSSSNPIAIVFAFFKSLLLIRHYQIEKLVSTGGFVTFPVVLAAKILRIPIVLLEQNILPGRTNRFLKYFADKIFVSFKESLAYFPPPKTVCAGNPVRKKFYQDEIAKGFIKEKIEKLPIILVFGGSQGALAINKWIQKQYDIFLNEPFILLHITGKKYYEKNFTDQPYTVLINKNKEKKVFVFPYFEALDMLYEKASLVICRAGATSIAELIYFQVPSILIPYPYAKDNHQQLNAKSFQSIGISELIEEKELDFLDIIKRFDLIIKNQKEQFEKMDFPKNPRQRIAEQIILI